MIAKHIREEITAALKAREETRLRVLRGLVAAFTNELVAQKKKPDEEVTDDMALAVIKRAVKQRLDSIEQFTNGGRPELADAEKEELAILETYLPATASKEEIRAVAEAKKAELGITDKAKSGMLMGAVIKEFKGNADGKDVKEVVESLFE